VKKRIFVAFFLVVFLVLISSFSGCQALKNLTNKIPENYTEGINYSKDYEEDALEIYDDAIVFKEFNAFGEAIIMCGSKDDFDDILDFYKEFFEDNEIVLSEEDEGRDEYYAQGLFDGYEFKIKIAEPDGDYEEELYENVITLMTRKLKDGEKLAASADPEATPVPDKETASDPKSTAAPTSSDDTKRPDVDSTETRLSDPLETGVWVLTYDMYSDESFWEWVIYIDSESTGTMYYVDYFYNNRWWDDFTYTVEDGILTFSFDNGDTFTYYAYYDYSALHLFAYEDFDIELNFYNYGEYIQTDYFYAYGDWMIFHTDSDFIGSLALWPDGSGYVYNWYGNYDDVPIVWENSDGTIYLYDDSGDLLDTFNWVHRYSILEYHSTDSEYSPYFYSRTDLNLLLGTYELLNTDEDDVYSWSITFKSDYSASVVLKSSEGTYEDDYVYWYISSVDGKIYLYLDEEYYGFNYHHNQTGLILYEDEYEYKYYFSLVE
jgi:hypothetical protein